VGERSHEGSKLGLAFALSLQIFLFKALVWINRYLSGLCVAEEESECIRRDWIPGGADLAMGSLQDLVRMENALLHVFDFFLKRAMQLSV
jgi:hypothetical protein